LERLASQLKKKRPGLIALMAANNETGVIQPWTEVQALCREYEVLFFCDAAQWLGKMPATGLGSCDFVSGCAHKFGGPKGVGFLKCPARGRMNPLLRGGKQEEGRRAGTENVAGVLAMMAALTFRETALATRQDRERLGYRLSFEQWLLANLPGSLIVGQTEERLWNTVSAIMPKGDSRQRWVVKLDKAGLAVSTGSACASGREEPSHVLAAMGFSPAQAARVLRFSSGWETTREEWHKLAEALNHVHRSMVEPALARVK
jgi:cysteine desulfurase